MEKRSTEVGFNPFRVAIYPVYIINPGFTRSYSNLSPSGLFTVMVQNTLEIPKGSRITTVQLKTRNEPVTNEMTIQDPEGIKYDYPRVKPG